jgi:hypothetical protein
MFTFQINKRSVHYDLPPNERLDELRLFIFLILSNLVSNSLIERDPSTDREERKQTKDGKEIQLIEVKQTETDRRRSIE